MSSWTYGAEHEFADWDIREEMPLGTWRTPDPTIVNSNGIAADPDGKLYSFGGEINTPPTLFPEGQADLLVGLARAYPEARINYRSNLHVHIRVPGLAEDLDALKRVASYGQRWLREILPIIDPIPEPPEGDSPEAKGARKRIARNRVSHHTVISRERFEGQLQATTVDEFHDAEVPRSADGRPLYFFQPRQAVSLRQLKQSDTIEFRHFFGTLDPEELLGAVTWCRLYLERALANADESPVAAFEATGLPRPRAAPYGHWMEERYERTRKGGDNTEESRREAIEAILREEKEAVVVLLLCYGNVCRSPLAEAVLRRAGVDVESAGFYRERTNRPAAKKVREFAADMGLDLSEHRSRVVDEEMVERADVVLVTDRPNYERFEALFPDAVERVEFLGSYLDPPVERIPDPGFMPRGEELDRVLGMVVASSRGYLREAL